MALDGRKSRLHGLDADILHSARIIFADGMLAAISPTWHAELVLALLGGGDNAFGVVIVLTFRHFKDPRPAAVFEGIFPPLPAVAEAF